jgi:proteasome lid subunit RPN8/RPN11
MRTRVRLPRPVRHAILAHARRDAPRECCGFLVGSGRRVAFAVALPNVAAKPTVRYRIDDRDHIEIRRWLRHFRPPLEIVGVYHSHPNGDARPSPTDRSEWHYPGWISVIVGLKRGRPRVTITLNT